MSSDGIRQQTSRDGDVQVHIHEGPRRSAAVSVERETPSRELQKLEPVMAAVPRNNSDKQVYSNTVLASTHYRIDKYFATRHKLESVRGSLSTCIL
jgi:hypothetical protein